MSNRVALVTGVPAVLVPLSVKSFTLRDSRSSPVITRAATMTKPKHGKQNSALMALNLTSHTAMFQILNQRVSASKELQKIMATFTAWSTMPGSPAIQLFGR